MHRYGTVEPSIIIRANQFLAQMECEICKNITVRLVSDSTTHRETRHIQTSYLQESSGSCSICRLIWEALLTQIPRWQQRGLQDDEKRHLIELRLGINVPLQIFWRKDGVYLEMYCRPEDPGPYLSSIGPCVEVAPYSSAQSCFNAASSWLSECLTSHTLCGEANPKILASRLIDVGDSNYEPFLNINPPDSGKYVSLTYCWGGSDFKTTSANLKHHSRQISYRTMPKTYQDAITICRRLRIRYLWIDALCIVQRNDETGEEGDWATESPRVPLIYQNATFTLAADVASSPNTGIFLP